MRKLIVLALAGAASFPLAAQQQAPQQQQPAPQAKGQAAQPQQQQEDKALEERLRTEGAAGGTRPVPPEKRKAVGAGAGPHRRDNLPSPAKLPRDEPVEPK